jgi:hypothetical protein
MKYPNCLILILIAGLISSCATSGNYCDIAKQIYPSRQDVLTRGTKVQILTENEKYEKFCGGAK